MELILTDQQKVRSKMFDRDSKENFKLRESVTDSKGNRPFD